MNILSLVKKFYISLSNADTLFACKKTIENILNVCKSELGKIKISAQNTVSENLSWQKIINQIYKNYKDRIQNPSDTELSPDRNLKIAVVNKFFYLKGGLEAVMFEEAKLLEQMGHNIAFFSMHHPLNPKDYKYNKFFADYTELENLGQEYSLLQKIKIVGNFIHNKQAARKFEEFLDDYKPDIIHCHGITHQLTLSILEIAKKKNIPVVQTLHDYQIICPCYTLLRQGKIVCSDLRCSKGNYWHCVINKCVKNSFSASILSALEMTFNNKNSRYINLVDKFISPSKFLKKTVVKTGLPEDKIVYIPNFINAGTCEPEYSNKGYFLYAGRLSPEKGLFTLLKAFKDYPAQSLILAGSGSLEKDIIAFKEENLINNVSFVGYKSKSELADLYKNCIASIIPSEGYENAPMTIIESFAYGKPVIASKLGGSIEMIQDGFNGYLFSAGDVEDLKLKIKYFIDNPNLSQCLGKNARDFVLQYYTHQVHLEKLLNLYNSVIKTPSNASADIQEKSELYSG